VVNTGILEFGTVVGGVFVQPEHCSHVQLVLEEISVLLGSPQLDAVPIRCDIILGAHEGQEPVGYDPIHVAIFNFLLLHVEVKVECVLVLPAQPGCLLQSAYRVF